MKETTYSTTMVATSSTLPNTATAAVTTSSMDTTISYSCPQALQYTVRSQGRPWGRG